MNALIRWDGTHNVVDVTDGDKIITIELGAFSALPAVRYVVHLSLERADLGLHLPTPRP
jgi:hypothetical protein